MTLQHRDPYKPRIPQLGSEEMRSVLTAKKLMELPLEAALGDVPDTNRHCLYLYIGAENFIYGEIGDNNGVMSASVSHLYVSRQLRGQGLGARLMKSFVAEAKSFGAIGLWSDNVSNMALGLRAKIFGEAALEFYDEDDEDRMFLPMTLEQAVATNNRINTIWQYRDAQNDEEWIGDIGVFIDLQAVDTSTWERPII